MNHLFDIRHPLDSTNPSYQLLPFTIEHYDAAYALWESTPGVGLSSADSRAAIEMFLQRNRGLSFTAWQDSQLVGTILCGHDGRRGWIHHLTVSPSARHQNIARSLVHKSLAQLKVQGIEKCHLFIFENNESGQKFWAHIGAQFRADLTVHSLMT